MNELRVLVVLLINCMGLMAGDPASSEMAPTTNNRSGISVEFQGVDGTDFMEEYYYHDRKVLDAKTVFIKSSTKLSMHLNEYATESGGAIRYRVDRDLNYAVNWHDSKYHPEYVGQLSFDSLRYEDGTPVVGTVGPKPGIAISEGTRNEYYMRGNRDSAGDEWHSITVAHDVSDSVSNPEYNVKEGKVFNFVVDPKAPCLTVQATGDAQFYTTPSKFYFLPRIHDQTTFFTPRGGRVLIRLRDLSGNNLFCRITHEGTQPADFKAVGSSSVDLPQDLFSDGGSVLECYSTGSESHVRKRRIVKNPDFPSKGEQHGNLLWGNTELKSIFERNINDGGVCEAWWNKLRTQAFYNGNNDSFKISGSREVPIGLLSSALIAVETSFDEKRLQTQNRSFADFAKEFMLMNLMRIDPVGLEQDQNGSSIPSREIKDRGYYTVGSKMRFLDLPFAYDLLISSFTSDKTPRGITPIEDLYIRDSMAKWVMFTTTELGGYHPHVPGMWGRCRFIASQVIALALPTYSTEYYGTSGVDGNHSVYNDLPFPSQALTWKEMYIDESHSIPGYPNAKFRADFDGQWTGPSSLTADGSLLIGQGAWNDRISYADLPLCGMPYGILAVTSRLHTKKAYPNFSAGIERMKVNDLWATKKLDGEDSSRFGPYMGKFPFVDNILYPKNTRDHVIWARQQVQVQADYFKIGFPYTLVWYDPRMAIQKPSIPRVLRDK